MCCASILGVVKKGLDRGHLLITLPVISKFRCLWEYKNVFKLKKLDTTHEGFFFERWTIMGAADFFRTI